MVQKILLAYFFDHLYFPGAPIGSGQSVLAVMVLLGPELGSWSRQEADRLRKASSGLERFAPGRATRPLVMICAVEHLSWRGLWEMGSATVLEAGAYMRQQTTSSSLSASKRFRCAEVLLPPKLNQFLDGNIFTVFAKRFHVRRS